MLFYCRSPFAANYLFNSHKVFCARAHSLCVSVNSFVPRHIYVYSCVVYTHVFCVNKDYKFQSPTMDNLDSRVWYNWWFSAFDEIDIFNHLALKCQFILNGSCLFYCLIQCPFFMFCVFFFTVNPESFNSNKKQLFHFFCSL